MKLRNRKTGEIGNLVLNINPNRESYSVLSTENGDTVCGNLVIADYNSLAELNEEWEDYEEPENFYIVEQRGTVGSRFRTGAEYEKKFKEIGNYFETKEEAEKAVEKLKAFKRLRDKGFRFDGYNACSVDYDIDEQYRKYISQDLDLLFGGEE